MSGNNICHFQAEVFNCWWTTLLLPRWCSGKESACQCRRHKRCRFNPWVGKIPWSRKWQPTPVFLPGKAHGLRSQVGYSPWGCKVLDMTEHACTHTQTHTHPPALFPLLRPPLRPWVEVVEPRKKVPWTSLSDWESALLHRHALYEWEKYTNVLKHWDIQVVTTAEPSILWPVYRNQLLF